MTLKAFVEECHDRLISDESRETIVAQNYLQDRGIKKATVVSHKVGYCPYEGFVPTDINYYGKNEIKDSDKGYGYFIRGRIIVPVYDEFDELVGFATRPPKQTYKNGDKCTWWNLPKPFYKGSHLYLLNKTRKNIFDKNKVILVEGYMDALVLHQEGLDNVCAIMGTALTMRKIALLARYCNSICLCLDNDDNGSGQRGRDKSIMNLHGLGFCEDMSEITALKTGEDPDEFVIENGVGALMDSEHILTEQEISKALKRVRYGWS